MKEHSFYYQVAAAANLAQYESGESAPCYQSVTFHLKEGVSAKRLEEAKGILAGCIAKEFGIDREFIESISKEEFDFYCGDYEEIIH